MGRISSEFKERMASTVASRDDQTERFDLKLWDHAVVGPHQAKLLIGFNEGMGVPKRSDIDQYVIATFGGQMRTVMESIRHHNADGNLITASVIKVPQVCPKEYASSMVRTGAKTYMDEKNQVWEMHNTDDGTFLARREKENIDEILAEKERQTKTAAIHHRHRLANLKTAGMTDPNVGDHVSVLYEGGLQYGKVTAVGEETVTVSLNGTVVKLPWTSIVEVTELSPAAQKEHEKFLVDFFTRAYGDEGFAKKLVKG
jgi:preprotein translocase subunit YajC